jgi:hypothetical protein
MKRDVEKEGNVGEEVRRYIGHGKRRAEGIGGS